MHVVCQHSSTTLTLYITHDGRAAVEPADSWWRLFDRFRFLLNALWVVPSGSMLRAYRWGCRCPWLWYCRMDLLQAGGHGL